MPGTALVILLQPKDKVILEAGSVNQSPVRKMEVTQGSNRGGFNAGN